MSPSSEEGKIPKGYQKLNGSERPRSASAKLLGSLPPNESVSATLVMRHKPRSPPMPDHQHWQNTPIGL